jgi:DNA-binding NarL/FixJ family response regulator
MSDKAVPNTRQSALPGESEAAAGSSHLQLRKSLEIAVLTRFLRRSDKQSLNAVLQSAESTALDLDHLTTRQREILYLVQQSKQEGQIARILGISRSAVKIHKRRIAHKLGIKSLLTPEPLPPIVLQNIEAANPDLSGLTHQQKEVFDLVQQGMRERDIARALGISKSAVKIRKHRIARKLGVKSLRRAEEPLPDITLQNPKAQAALGILSPGEKRVFALVLQCKLEKEIAYIMGVSKEAVKQHKRNIRRKLKVKSIIELISIFGDTGQITVEKLKDDPNIGKELGIGLPHRTEQLIKLVEQGLQYTDIAAKLGVTLGMVHTSLSLLFKRLNVHSKAELVRWNNRRKQYLALRNALDQPAASSGELRNAE